MRAARGGVVLAAGGFASILIGLFSFVGRCAVPGAPCPSPRLSEVLTYGGLALLFAGIALLVLSGWRGRTGSWVLAAVATVPATWTFYEVARQGPCQTAASGLALTVCNAIPFGLGGVAAPLVSALAALIVLGVGGLRLRYRSGLAAE